MVGAVPSSRRRQSEVVAVCVILAVLHIGCLAAVLLTEAPSARRAAEVEDPRRRVRAAIEAASAPASGAQTGSGGRRGCVP